MLQFPSALAIGCLIIGAGTTGLAQSVVYDNGPVALGGGPVITYGAMVTDSFNLAADSTIASVTVGLGLFQGDVLETMNWSITTAPFGGTVEISGTSSPTLTAVGNYYGNELYAADFPISPTALAAGTHWLQLSGAQTTGGNTMYWYENNGSSAAYQYDPGTSTTSSIGSESFQILGSPAPEPTTLSLVAGGICLLARRIKK